MREELSEELPKVVSLANEDVEFFQQRLQVLLGRLLTMEPNLVMKPLFGAREGFGGPIIVLGLAHPLPGGVFHKGPCPW